MKYFLFFQAYSSVALPALVKLDVAIWLVWPIKCEWKWKIYEGDTPHPEEPEIYL